MAAKNALNLLEKLHKRIIFHSFIHSSLILDRHVIKLNNKHVKKLFTNWSQEKGEATQEDKRILILNNSCMVATPRNETRKKNNYKQIGLRTRSLNS